MGLFKRKINTENISKIVDHKYIIRRYFELLLGILLVAISYNLFLLPNNIVSGGVSGVGIILNKVLDINPSEFVFITSLLLLILSYFVLGKEATKGSIIGSLLFPVFIALTANINDLLQIDTTNVLLSVIFGGVLYGFGAGLVFRAGFTTGGTDILNQIASKYLHMSMGNAILITDGVIVASSVFFFGVTNLMYALIVIYITGILTDKVILGISDKKAFYIITNQEEEVKQYIMKELNHGITIFNARGGYSKEKENVLLCVVPTNEYFKLKEGIHEIDKEAFFVITDAYEVFGGE